MGRKVFLSFLGTTDYSFCNYFDSNGKVEDVRFVQEALVRLHCTDWTSDDVVVILLTDVARKHNWENFTFINKFTKSETPRIGLKSILSELNLPGSIIDKTVKDGNTEAEIWENFTTIFDLLLPADKLVIDITHAYRYFPVFAVVLANYAKFLKKVGIEGIYYGNYEGRNEVTNDAPILDITNFARLQAWTSAADIFVNFGNAQRLTELTKDTGLHQTALKMQEAMRIFSTVRGRDMINGRKLDNLKADIKKLKKNFPNDAVNAPFLPLIDHLQNSIKSYKQNTVLNGFYGVRFCIENELIQQSVTLLQEVIISYILSLENEKWDYKYNRIILSACLQKTESEYTTRLNLNEQSKSNLVEMEKKLKEKFYQSFFVETFGDLYNDLSDPRNDLNHAGMKGDAEENTDRFVALITGLYNEVAELVNQLEKGEVLELIIQPENEYKMYAAFRSENFKKRLKDFETMHGKMKYEEYSNFVYGKASHTWEEEKTLHRWCSIESSVEFYLSKL